MGYKRHRGTLARRYGRSRPGPQAISVARGDGLYDVVVVDSHGNVMHTVTRGVPYGLARSIIRRRHG